MFEKMKEISCLVNLTRLELYSHDHSTGFGLNDMVSNLTNLKQLLLLSAVYSSEVSQLTNLPNLEYFDFCENPDTASIDALAHFSKLKELDILLGTDSSEFEDRPIADYMIEKLPHVP
jgi:Leucine-rich repeat (LRR) protein